MALFPKLRVIKGLIPRSGPGINLVIGAMHAGRG